MKSVFLKKFIVNVCAIVLITLPSYTLLAQTAVVPQNCSGPDCDYQHFVELIENVVTFLVQLAIAVTAIVFAYAGWLYMTSGGDSGKIKQAHEMFTKVLWGFLFALGAYLIVKLILTSLGAKVQGLI